MNKKYLFLLIWIKKKYNSLILKNKTRIENEPIGLGSILYNIDRKYLKYLLVDNWEKTIDEHVKLTNMHNNIINNKFSKL